MPDRGVAIIGVSGIYPDAENLQQFALNLAQGRDSVREVSAQRKALAGVPETAPCYPVASLENIDKFDHEFFGISLKEAEYMDPQQRLLLQLACAAIENAGYSLGHFRGSRTATIVSASNHDYSKLYSVYDPSMITGQLPSALAGRIAYSLDLRGPAMVIDTACSSSLLAIHEAYQKVAAGQVDYALAGGINIYFINNYVDEVDGDTTSVGINSPDGRCKTFDMSANGAGWGEGGGLVLLKSLQRAVADRDHIYAVIKGGGVNQDGGRSNGLAAPSPQAQADAIVEACKDAGISAATISYLEAHGTGTELGDPIEIQGITEAFKQFTTQKQFCAISALKTNIGHLAGAAGIAGLTKIILSFKHKKLFPSLHFRQPNPFIDFKNSPVFVNTQLRDWEVDETVGIRRAGISSFGLSGTNVHLVMEEAPPVRAIATDETVAPVLVTHSAKTPEALRRNLAHLATFLESSDHSLADIAYTLNLGRNDYQYRFARVVSSCQELRHAIEEHLSQPAQYQKPDKAERSLVFLLPGDSQVSDEVIDRFNVQYPAFRNSWEQCQTNGTQTAFNPNVRLVALLYSLYQACLSLGLSSPKVIGTGVGNLAVAIVTGRIELPEALKQAASYRNGDVQPDPLKLKTVLDQIRTANPLFLEFGRDTRLGKEISQLQIDSPVMPLLNGNNDLLSLMAQLYLRGAKVNWEKFYEGSEHYRVELPTYSFEETSCWIPQISVAQPATLQSSLAAAAAPVATETYGELEEEATATERTLASIWGEVLKVKRLGLDDDFFDLGGNSLDGTQIISRIKEAFEIKIEFETLYDYPTIALLGRHLDSLRGVDSPLQETVSEPMPEPAMEKRAGLVMSSGQQRLWFLDQLEPGTTFYNLPYALSIKGSLNVTALERSLQEVYRRHEVLRGIFSDLEGKAVSVIDWSLTTYLPVVDLRELPVQQNRRAAEELTNAEARRPFDLMRGPLLRLSLLQLADHHYILLLTLHHIVADRWSIQVLIRELALLYEAYVEGHASPLPELPIQYADYAQWQRQWLQSDEYLEQLEYWKQQLGNTAPVLNLPTDYSRPRVPTFQSGHETITLSRELTAALKELSRREGVTLFMVLTAGFQSLLHRYTQQQEVSLGTPVAGRTRRETEALIGFFVNTLVLRTDFSGEPTFVEVLRRVREVALGAYAHQEVPFEKLVEELEVERSLSHTPLFQVMLALQNLTLPTVELAELAVEVLETEHGTTQFDLVLFLTESGEELVGRLEYSRDLFAEETVRRLLAHFERLLEGAVRNPAERVSRLPLLSAAERAELVERWNETAVEYEDAATVVTAFERQVEKNGAAVAVVSGAAALRYEELNERANQLAHYLRRRGVGAETVVGVCVERGVELLTVLLGILKAGGAYLPLDPEYPWERLSYMVGDAGVRLVVTERSVRERLSGVSGGVSDDGGVEWLELEAVAEEIGQESVANLEQEISGTNLAYVIYTSGSTGQPKGVLIEHRAFVNYVQTMTNRLDLKPGERILKFASLSFDASIVQIFPALLGGATVAIEPNVNKLSNHELLNLSARLNLTVLDLPAAYWRQWVEDMARHHVILPETLRVFMTGGETLPGEILVKWSRLVQRPAMFLNSYGPTETTVGATVHTTTSTQAAGLDVPRVTIGRPLANVKIYLLDGNLQPIPIGVTGELYIGGIGVARGYLNRPELTAGKFVPNPFAETPGERLYRTGDVARYLPNGDIDFLGRKDGQVKIRGFRVELGEIETSLRRHPGIQEVVVSLKEYQPGDKRLIAYYVSATRDGLTTSELKSQLKETLPDYMIPASFVRLEAMPLTASAKIDRRALLEVEPEDQFAESFTGAARTPTEEIVAGQWAEVLDLPQVGIHDDFFDLGGHSLLATQLISRLREVFQVELPLRSLFETPTVSGIAALIDQASTQQLSPISPAPADAELPLSFSQQRFWFLDQLNAGNAAFNIPAAVLLNGALDQTALEQSFNEVVKRHEALRTTFRMSAAGVVQVVNPARPLNISLLDLTALTEDARRAEAQRVAAAESVQSFDLANGPLLSVVLLRLTEFQHLLTLTIHHIAFDGWSLGVLLADFAEFYTEFVTGTSRELPALPIQYGDYAYWQRQTLTGELWDEHLSYWRRQLEGAPTMLDLPTDRPRATVQSFRGARKSFALSNTLTEALKSLSRRESATLFMTVFAAFASVLNRFTGQEDLVIGADIANRTRLETEPLIGCFLNHVVLRADLAGHPTFSELLRRVRQIILGAYAHQDFPFDALVHALQPERTINATPLFQVLLVFLNTPFKSIELPGLTLTPQEVDTGLAKFDLTLFMGMGPAGLEGSLEYNSDLFDEATAARLVGNLQSLLEAIVDHPHQELDQLQIGAEDEVLVAEFNEVLE